MPLTRISTYAQQQLTLRDVTNTESRLTDLQNQISSGFKSSNYEGLAGQVEPLAAVDHKLSKTQNYLENNSVALTALHTTDNALSQLIQSANELKNEVLLRRNDSFGNAPEFQDEVQGAWKQITAQLNSTSGGRYVFSGSATNTQAVDDSNFPLLAAVGIPDDGYYTGSKQDITLRAQDNFDLKYNIRADDPAIQKIFAGIAMAALGGTTGDDTTLKQAYDLLADGIQDVTSLQAENNTNIVTVNNINDQHNAQNLYWKGVKEDMVNTDIVSASTQVATNQGILQASFQIFARITSLRLSDYLR
jgi:flagellar hook-associated protein 3 FlgL